MDQLESRIHAIKSTYGLGDEEVHTAWMVRRYVEQEAVANFERLSHFDRKLETQKRRDQHLIRIAANGNKKQLKAAKLNYRKTVVYLHLTQIERLELIR